MNTMDDKKLLKNTTILTTRRVGFIRIVTAIVLMVAHPPFRYALGRGFAPEIANRVTRLTSFGFFVRIVPTVVLAVAERPVWYAAEYTELQ